MNPPDCPIPLLPTDGLDDGRFVDEALLAEGWTPRFLADPARLAESKEIYFGLNMEVMAVEIQADNVNPECSQCFFTPCPPHFMLYTRRPGDPADSNDPSAREDSGRRGRTGDLS